MSEQKMVEIELTELTSKLLEKVEKQMGLPAEEVVEYALLHLLLYGKEFMGPLRLYSGRNIRIQHELSLRHAMLRKKIEDAFEVWAKKQGFR